MARGLRAPGDGICATGALAYEMRTDDDEALTPNPTPELEAGRSGWRGGRRCAGIRSSRRRWVPGMCS